MLNLNTETVQFIIDKAHEFQALGDVSAEEGSEEPSPAYAELKSTIDDLEPDQQITLVGLMWLGRGDYSTDDWIVALGKARDGWNGRAADYLIGTPLLAYYLEEGLNQLDSVAES